MPSTRRSARLSAVGDISTAEGEADSSTQSNTSQQADTPASTPPAEDVPEMKVEVTADPGIIAVTEEAEEDPLITKERKHQKVQKARGLTKQIATARRKRKIALSPQERAAKAGELQNLLKQSAAFSAILTKKTQVLGRVGTALDGKSLGQHDLKMAEQPKILVGGTMRDYQLEGLTWMYEICAQGMSGILADEMGLGKTVQTIALIALLREQENYLGPHLIVAPLSTISNWMNEFRHWCPSIPTVQFHGVPEERAEIARTKIFPYLKGGRPTEKFPVVITSYEMVLKERSVLGKINWEFIIVDEGHRLKNFDSMLFRELKQFQSATRLLITGTPLQNNLKELWALLNFLMPTIFKDWEAFESWFDFGDLADDEDANAFLNDNQKKDLLLKIHTVLQPMILRRIKKDVAAYLPKKREYLLHAPMTREQTDLYNVLSDKTQDTRSYLENKIVERLTRSTNSPASPGMSATTSRNASVSPKLELGDPTELALRPSPHKGSPKKSGSPASTLSVTNAFSKMMATATAAKRGRGRPRKSTAVSTETTDTEASVKPNSKRKAAPTIESPASKSAKSSRQSTPASSVRRSTRRRHILRDDDPDEDDLLDDDEFETKLLKEAAKDDAYAKLQDEPDVSPDELERTKTLELAKKEIQQKKFGNPMMQLRKVCNSPHLFYNPWPTSDDVDESLVTSSGKMLMLDRLLPTLFAKGHKVLIFSQFVEMINLIEDYCRVLRGWDTCRIVGDVSQADRAEQIERFNNDPDVKIFLLTTRAGGQGINLASADTVILFDSDWNPQQDLQAQDRAHRIGQTRPVIVFRLATTNTVEEGLLMSAEGKRRLEKLVIKKGNIQTMMGRGDDVTADDLKRLLLKDGEVYRFSGHKEILSDQDLEVLCDRSDEAYEKASAGEGNASAFTVVETAAEGISTVAASQPTQNGNQSGSS